jgi:hypothetical protein
MVAIDVQNRRTAGVAERGAAARPASVPVRPARHLALVPSAPAAPPRPAGAAPEALRRHRPSAADFRRRRLVAAVLALSVVAVAVRVGGGLGAGVGGAEHHPRTHTYVVQSGDTLYEIAHRFAPERDWRRVVDDLRGQLGGVELVAGESITFEL